MNTITQDEPLLLTTDQVAAKLAISVRTLWRLVRARQVPQPVRFNRHFVRWKNADVEAYVASLTAAPRF